MLLNFPRNRPTTRQSTQRSSEKLRMSIQATDTKGFGFSFAPVPSSPSSYQSFIASIFGESAFPEATYCFKKEEKSWSFDLPVRRSAKRLCDASGGTNSGDTKRTLRFDLNVVDVEDDYEEEDADQKNGSCDNKVCLRGHWKPSEDAKLKELVEKLGPQNWNLIAESLEGRSGKSCRLRWFNQLDPKINKKPFSVEEEERLFSAHRVYGNKWALVARLFPGRTDNSVKNHWHVISARKHREQSNLFQRSSQLLVPNDSRPPTDSKTGRFSSLAVKISNPSYNEDPQAKTKSEESSSTCTELSLSPSLPKATSSIVFATNRPRMITDSSMSRPARRTEKIGSGAWRKFVREINQVDRVPRTSRVPCNERSRISETNLEISACDSTATEKNPLRSASRSTGHPVPIKSIRTPFIDFLGIDV